MRWRVQHCSSLWVALTHALLFQRKGFYSKREQRARARKLQQQLMHYICDWQRNHFRTHGFVPGHLLQKVRSNGTRCRLLEDDGRRKCHAGERAQAR